MVKYSSYSVYSITGGWGTGKTCFIRMWENKLGKEKQVFVHIDAFKNDYETEPFLMLINAFRDFMTKKNISKEQTQKWLDTAKAIFTTKNMLRLGFNILVEKTVGLEPVKEFINSAYNSCFDELTSEKSLYDDLVSSLAEITEEFETPVHIIIDELDRCRPDFALETLERIKHIFHMKNVKFILVYNEEAMKSMIKQKYGSEINADRYLNKFVQKSFLFDTNKRLKVWFNNAIDKDTETFVNVSMLEYLNTYSSMILKVKSIYGLSLRDIQQILSSIKQYRNCRKPEDFVSIMCIEFLKLISKDEFNAIDKYFRDDKISPLDPPIGDTLTHIATLFSIDGLQISPLKIITYYFR
jgi:hypothetical protein